MYPIRLLIRLEAEYDAVLQDPRAMVSNSTRGAFATHRTTNLESVTNACRATKGCHTLRTCTPPVKSLRPEVNSDEGSLGPGAFDEGGMYFIPFTLFPKWYSENPVVLSQLVPESCLPTSLGCLCFPFRISEL